MHSCINSRCTDAYLLPRSHSDPELGEDKCFSPYLNWSMPTGLGFLQNMVAGEGAANCNAVGRALIQDMGYTDSIPCDGEKGFEAGPSTSQKRVLTTKPWEQGDWTFGLLNVRL